MKIREKWKSIDADSEMFDFQTYYQAVAEQMPNGARIVEAGVSNGRSIIFLAEALLNLGKEFRLVGVDNLAYGGAKQLNSIISNIGKAGLGEYIEFWALDSLVASCEFNDGYLHHVFLDSSHTYMATKQEIRCWLPKMLHSFFLSGHDYFSEENPGVRQAVDEIVPKNRLHTQQTDKGNGIWTVYKNDDLPI
jgi:cephalosporin hydroxylase